MNTKTLLTVKTDKVLKEDAARVAQELGIPLGTLVNSNLTHRLCAFVHRNSITEKRKAPMLFFFFVS